MTVMTGKTVREFALENHAATRVFEKLGIDYCCGGNKSLEEACGAANVPVEQVLDAIAAQSQRGAEADRNWQVEPLFELVGHIKDTHHVYVREESLASVLFLIKSARSTPRIIPSFSICRADSAFSPKN